MRTTPLLRRAFPCLLALATLAPAPRAAPQGEVKVSARLSAGVLRLGDAGSVNVTVENADDARVVEVPAVEGLSFSKPGQPSLRQSSSWVNGHVWSESTLTIPIPFRPAAEGDYDIPPIAIETAGKRFETKGLHLTVVKDIKGADFGYLEVHASAPRVVEGQPFTVELVFGWEVNEQVNFAELNLPWWDSLPGALEVGDDKAAPQQNKVDGIIVNGSVQLAAEQLEPRARGGRNFLTLRLTKTYLPTRSGTLEFPTSFFEFGRRRVTFLDSRRESHFVQAEPFAVEVVSLPSAGQPLDFSGAVGTLAARASADTRDVRVGDSIKLAVEWTGQGNLEYFRPPDLAALDAFRGFRVYGTTEEKAFERRKVVYDLAPLSPEVHEIPPVPLSVFDPESGRYRTLVTDAIPVRVRALEKSAGLSDEEQRFERDLADIDVRPPAGAAGARGDAQDRFLLAALVAVPLIGLVARARARRLAGDPAAPAARRRRRARRELARALGRDEGAAVQQAALLEFLGARTREPAAAWNGRALERWADEHARGLAAELRRDAGRTLAELEAAVYGGATPPGRERILALARALEEGGL